MLDRQKYHSVGPYIQVILRQRTQNLIVRKSFPSLKTPCKARYSDAQKMRYEILNGVGSADVNQHLWENLDVLG